MLYNLALDLEQGTFPVEEKGEQTPSNPERVTLHIRRLDISETVLSSSALEYLA